MTVTLSVKMLEICFCTTSEGEVALIVKRAKVVNVFAMTVELVNVN